jgi:CRISPR/Cas system endoribonuclease Cas6 (RAMP superfamily)
VTERELTHLWVSDIAGETVVETVPHTMGRRVSDKVLPGFVGDMTLQCDDAMLAAAVDCYLRFGEYSGVGPLTTHGFGTVSLSATRR